MTTAPPFPYFGGKTLLGPRIADLMPAHRHYVEPFCGSLAVLLAKPASAMETVNDVDGDLMVFWQVLRDRPADLARAVALTPHARAEFERCWERPDDLDDVERARRVHVQLTQGRGAVGVRTGWRHYVRPAGRFGMPDYLLGYLGRIERAAGRLQHVSLDSRPAAEIIDRYGSEPDVLLYVDPPYLGSTRSGRDDPRRGTRRYRHEMLGEPEHRDLLDALTACMSAVVLSGYDSDLHRELLDGWHRAEFAAGTGQSARGEWSERTEVVWSNRPFPRPPGLWDVEDPAVTP